MGPFIPAVPSCPSRSGTPSGIYSRWGACHVIMIISGERLERRKMLIWDNRLTESHLGAAVTGDCFRKARHFSRESSLFFASSFFFYQNDSCCWKSSFISECKEKYPEVLFVCVRLEILICNAHSDANTGSVPRCPTCLDIKKTHKKQETECLAVWLKLRGKQWTA